MEMVKIIFEFTTKYGTFRDAIHLPHDHSLTEDQINSMKIERLNNWLAVIETPQSEPDSEEQ